MPVNADKSAELLNLAKSFTSSYEQRDRLSAALREHLGVTPRDSFWLSDDGVDDVLGPVAIYRFERDAFDANGGGAVKGLAPSDDAFFRATFARTDDGYTFGDPVKVIRRTDYVRDSSADEDGDAGADETEVPEWLARALAMVAQLTKGAGHRYIRRVPRAGGGYRYFYKVSGGGGLGHDDEMKVGAKFRVTNGGKDGHFEVVGKDASGNLRIKHDESGHESTVSPGALKAMLHAEHAQSLDAHKAKLAADIKDAADPKAKARLLAEAGKYEHTRDLAEPDGADGADGAVDPQDRHEQVAKAHSAATGGWTKMSAEWPRDAAGRPKNPARYRQLEQWSKLHSEAWAAHWNAKSSHMHGSPDAADRSAKAAAATAAANKWSAENGLGTTDNPGTGMPQGQSAAESSDRATVHHLAAARDHANAARAAGDADTAELHVKAAEAHAGAADAHRSGSGGDAASAAANAASEDTAKQPEPTKAADALSSLKAGDLVRPHTPAGEPYGDTWAVEGRHADGRITIRNPEKGLTMMIDPAKPTDIRKVDGPAKAAVGTLANPAWAQGLKSPSDAGYTAGHRHATARSSMSGAGAAKPDNPHAPGSKDHSDWASGFAQGSKDAGGASRAEIAATSGGAPGGLNEPRKGAVKAAEHEAQRDAHTKAADGLNDAPIGSPGHAARMEHRDAAKMHALAAREWIAPYSAGVPELASSKANAATKAIASPPEKRKPTRKSMSTVTDPERDLAKSLATSHRTAAEAQPDAGAKDAHEAAAQACDAAVLAGSTGEFRKALGASERIGGLIKAWSGIPGQQRPAFDDFRKSMTNPIQARPFAFSANNGTGDAMGQMGRAVAAARPAVEHVEHVAPEPTTYSAQRGAVNGLRKGMGAFYGQLAAGAAQQMVPGVRCPPEAQA